MHSPSPIRRTHRHTTNRNTTNRKATNRNTTNSHPSIRSTSPGTYHVTNSISNHSPSSKPHSASLLPPSAESPSSTPPPAPAGPAGSPESPTAEVPSPPPPSGSYAPGWASRAAIAGTALAGALFAVVLA
ncbi:classical arabinogalactan protein 4 [Prunus yedoensis var. nudiflora]|uniref:Classical arabinogalactan protein 4 n=1 Tax=Prunus yedoensis var. nudiflora TaxID=2094558 RepID=A0A314UCC4_PRUYE|nr:classical arabinogalactan protein 4 [Prunus yedoensis var. nudiflora]